SIGGSRVSARQSKSGSAEASAVARRRRSKRRLSPNGGFWTTSGSTGFGMRTGLVRTAARSSGTCTTSAPGTTTGSLAAASARITSFVRGGRTRVQPRQRAYTLRFLVDPAHHRALAGEPLEVHGDGSQ